MQHMKALQQAVNHGSEPQKVHRIIELENIDQDAWMKPFIGLNTEFKTRAKMILKKISSS